MESATSTSAFGARDIIRKPPRDHRIDLVRGFALATIFINHMPGNWIGQLTPRNFGFSDSAELFVLLAGYAAAKAYYPLFSRGDRRGLAIKALRRAGVLYGAHIVTTLAAIALFWAAIAASGDLEARDLIGIAPVLADPGSSLIAVLVGGFQLGYFNILPMYVVLLALLPAMFWLAAKDLRLLALVSAGAYLATNIAGLKLPSSPNFESWFFNPIAWQCLFTGGLVLGIRQCRGQTLGYHPALFAAAAGYLVFSAVWTTTNYGASLGARMLPDWLGSLQKPNLPVARLLHVAALAYVISNCCAWAWLSRVPKNFVLTRMGRHSLPVFMAGSLLSMAGWLVSNAAGEGLAVETLVAAAGLALMAWQARWIEGDARFPQVPKTFLGYFAEGGNTARLALR